MHVLGKIAPPTGKKNGPITKKPAAPPAVDPAAVMSVGKEKPPEDAAASPDALDAFVAICNEQDPSRAIMLLYWKNRHQEPQFSINVTAADLKAFEDCVEYLKVKPEIRVFRPQGAPAHPGSPATDTRSAIPPRPAGKPKDYVVIQMVDEEGNAIVPIENNEQDLQRGQEAQRIKRIRETAPQLAAQLIADLQANTTSSSTVMEAAEALKLLARG